MEVKDNVEFAYTSIRGNTRRDVCLEGPDTSCPAKVGAKACDSTTRPTESTGRREPSEEVIARD